MAQMQARALVLAVLAAILLHRPASAEPMAREHLVRAAFVYNIAKFVEWPADSYPGPDAPVVMCIAGEDARNAAQPSLADKTIRERPLRIVGAGGSTADRCQLVYVAQGATPPSAADLAGGRATLTVCDPGVGSAATCMVRLLIVDNKLRFAIDLAAASRANLKISSSLLALATDVVNP